MSSPLRRTSALAALLVALAVAVSACGSSGSATDAASASASAAAANSGVTVTGAYGTTPTVTIPKTAAPTTLTSQVLTQGTGATVDAGDLLVANYVGETWASGKVFDSSFSRNAPAGFVIGKGQVITGWDKTLVGQKLGSRVLLTIPPADGYGSQGQSSAGISGTDTLVFVVDLVATYKPGASAPGTAVTNLPSGWPTITNTPAQEPKITSVKGVKTPTKAISELLVKGSGAPIDSSKSLALELVQTDLATGKQSQSTWSSAPESVAATNVLQVATALKGQNVGSRAVVLIPATKANAATGATAQPASVLVIDVVGQF